MTRDKWGAHADREQELNEQICRDCEKTGDELDRCIWCDDFFHPECFEEHTCRP